VIVIDILKTIPQAFFRPQTYTRVATEWTGIGILYILITAAVFIIPSYFYINNFISNIFYDAPKSLDDRALDSNFIPDSETASSLPRALNPNLATIASQIPIMTFHKGVLNFDGAQPYNIYHPENGTTMMVIDTEKSISDFLLETPPSDSDKEITEKDSITPPTEIVFLLKDGIYLRWIDGTPVSATWSDINRSFQFDDSTEITIDQNIIEGWIRYMSTMTPFFSTALSFVLWLQLIVVFALQTMLIAILAIIAGPNFSFPKLPFEALLRVSALAATPAYLLEAISYTFESPVFAYKQWTFMAIHCTYMYIGLDAIKKSGLFINTSPDNEAKKD